MCTKSFHVVRVARLIGEWSLLRTTLGKGGGGGGVLHIRTQDKRDCSILLDMVSRSDEPSVSKKALNLTCQMMLFTWSDQERVLDRNPNTKLSGRPHQGTEIIPPGRDRDERASSPDRRYLLEMNMCADLETSCCRIDGSPSCSLWHVTIPGVVSSCGKSSKLKWLFGSRDGASAQVSYSLFKSWGPSFTNKHERNFKAPFLKRKRHFLGHLRPNFESLLPTKLRAIDRQCHVMSTN